MFLSPSGDVSRDHIEQVIAARDKCVENGGTGDFPLDVLAKLKLIDDV